MRAISKTKRKWLFVGFIGLVTIMAGCSGPGAANNADDNKAPEAKLETSKNTGWTAEGFNVDGSQSSDPDGEITKWVFDFGDGTQSVTVTDETAAEHVNHSYLKGGEYTITLTVFDDGKDTTGQKSSQATQTVAINQRYMVEQVTLSPAPVQGSETKSNSTYKFMVHDKADTVEATLEVTNTVPSGSSEVEIRLLDAKGTKLDEEKVTISGTTSSKTIDLTGVATEVGEYRIEMKAMSGAVLVDGDVEVKYDKGYTN